MQRFPWVTGCLAVAGLAACGHVDPAPQTPVAVEVPPTGARTRPLGCALLRPRIGACSDRVHSFEPC